MAGEFTQGALEQLKSLHFNVVHIPYPAVIAAFQQVNIDAYTHEGIPDEVVLEKIQQWDQLSSQKKRLVAKTLFASQEEEVSQFYDALAQTVTRKIDEIIILPLHGLRFRTTSISEAKALLEDYNENSTQSRFERYEVQIRFMNNNEIIGKFNDKPSAIEFLDNFQI